jgi:hypothetical protein
MESAINIVVVVCGYLASKATTLISFLWPQNPQQFLFGCIVLILIEISRFRSIPDTLPIPGLRARDFAPPLIYASAAGSFVLTMLLLYYLFCQISPDVLQGAIRIFGPSKEYTLPRENTDLYILAIFVGLFQPIVPKCHEIIEGIKSFFHELARIPEWGKSVSSDLENRLLHPILGDKEAKCRKLDEVALLSSFGARVDDVFLRSKTSDIGVPLGSVYSKMDTFSDREIDEAFRKFLFVLGISAIRKGGKDGVEDVRKKLGIDVELPPHNSFIPVFCISAALMFVAIIGIFLILDELRVWLYLKSATDSVLSAADPNWPNSSPDVWNATWVAALPIITTLGVVLITFGRVSDRVNSAVSRASSSQDYLRRFFSSAIWMFLLSITTSAACYAVIRMYNLSLYQPKSDSFVSWASYIVAFTIVPVFVAMVVALYLCKNTQEFRFGFFKALLVMIVGTGLLSALSAQSWLKLSYCLVNNCSGNIYLEFIMLSNTLVSVAIFLATSAFFAKAQLRDFVIIEAVQNVAAE